VLSLQLIRENPAMVEAELRRRGESDPPVPEIVRLDEQRRKLLVEAETLRARRNEVSREIGRSKGAEPAAIERVRAEMRQVGARIGQIEAEIAEAETKLNALMLELPNLPDPSVPFGTSEDDFEIVGSWGTPKEVNGAVPHWDLGPVLGILDFERGVKLAGTRFYVLWGGGANLQRALIQWMLDVHVRDHGYTEVMVPYLLKRDALVWATQLPRFAGNLYHDDESDLWLIPTAESALAGLYANEIVEGGLPIKMVAYSACFRKEQFASGRDTRGIKRGHQFDKVEMFQIVEPGADMVALEEMVDQASDLLRRLELPHRLKALPGIDMSFQAAKTIDIEIWSPGVEEWLEVSSCSTVRDFQARRANLRFRRERGARPEYPYELNASGLALPRLMIGIMENYQLGDGSILVPEVLRPYMGGLERIEALSSPRRDG
jgi:seryl-tRNA synthetase